MFHSTDNIVELRKYNFIRHPGSDIEIYDSDSKKIGVISEDGRVISPTFGQEVNVEIISDFEKFKLSDPEFLVYAPNALSEQFDYAERRMRRDDIRDIYIRVMQGCLMIRAKSAMKDMFNPGVANQQIDNIINWLMSTDFFVAPASTKYHDSYSGGLVDHSLRVAIEAIRLLDLPKFNNIDIASAVLCALVHDWCKINKYEAYQRNVKNDETGCWERVASYRYKDDIMIPLGHGEASMYMAMKMIKLSIDEACAIRHHMGAWAEQGSYNVNDLQYANEHFPLVLLLQFADQLSLVNY